MRNYLLSAVRIFVLILSLTLFSSSAFSQSITTGNGKFEVGLGFGPMFFLGDLGGSAGIGKGFVKDLDFPLTKFSKMLYVNYYAAEWLGFRLALNHGQLEGSDAEAPNKGGDETFRIARNLSFKSSVLEAYFAAELYPTVFFERYEGLQGKLRPYGLIGIGAYKFNPKTKLNGQWVELKPLRTEGQGLIPGKSEYKLMQAEVPVGLGFKYYIKENMYVGIEVMHRKLFTDYIDDVSTTYPDPIIFNSLPAADGAKARQLFYRGDELPSSRQMPGINEQRGDPKDDDAFFSTILRFGWRLNTYDNARRQMRCPVFF
ncbi:MAG: outer membrane beta-barrel protein [Chitinophagaceae bacterium]